MNRLIATIIAICLLVSVCSTAFACDENQTSTYVTQILFGDSALSHASDDKVRMLLSALYLCSEQADGLGQDKLDYIKSHGVSGIPALSGLNIKGSELLSCSHYGWDHEYAPNKANQGNRKRTLQNTVNAVFDFGLINNIFGSGGGKCNSFAAVLYYSHILADYLADDPSDTEVNINGRLTSAYSGQTYVEINNNRPSFSSTQKTISDSFTDYSKNNEFYLQHVLIDVLNDQHDLGNYSQLIADNVFKFVIFSVDDFIYEIDFKLVILLS